MTRLGDATHPLDVEQRFEQDGAAPSFEVRDELVDLLRRDLLGPWAGEREEFDHRDSGPLGRYLVGLLGPRRLDDSARDTDPDALDTELGADVGTDPELAHKMTPVNAGRLWASSMGVSCAVSPEVDRLLVRVEWGRYLKEKRADMDGKEKSTWVRRPVHKDVEIDVSARSEDLEVDPHIPGVRLRVEARPKPTCTVVDISLVNGQHEPSTNKDTAWLFQPRLTVTALDGAAAVFVPVDELHPDDRRDDVEQEEQHLRLLYREQRRYGTGRNVAVATDIVEGARLARRLRTEWVPVTDVPATVAPTVDDTPQLAGLELSMDALADATLSELDGMLRPLATGYADWLDEQEAKIAELTGRSRETAEGALAEARLAAGRVAAGVDLLTDDTHPHHADALRAFRFAQLAMAAQRRHTQITAARRDDETLTYQAAEAAVLAKGAAAASWRPFQLAFVLLNLPALTDPRHAERRADHEAIVDLLFFPTGGGKTEAYLGLTAYTFAIRRLQGVVGTGAEARDGADGVSVLMRYTLRLLTAQQFQRAATLVCAAENLRRAQPELYGGKKFRIGMWVGASVAPNWYKDAAGDIKKAKDAGNDNRNKVLQIQQCPWCGEKLAGYRDYDPDDTRRRTILYCPRGEGRHACPFSRRQAEGEGLPILTVDEEIYRLLPSLLIATVDKFAQLPWRGYAGMLFGRVGDHCPRHGYRHPDLDAITDCRARHNAEGKKYPAVRSEAVVRLRPVDLIIQDELHLISGALGTTVGLFEAAIDELCSWTVDGERVGPKIVASTATTKRAAAQVRGIFARRLAVFPPPVLDVADSFFARQTLVSRSAPGRRYLGVCAHGIRLKQAEIRLWRTLLLAGQELFDKYGTPADPYMTPVGYFNATRELAGMRRYLDDDVTTRVRPDPRQTHWPPRLSSRGLLSIVELTSRINSADISAALGQLESGFNAELDTSHRRDALNEEWKNARKQKREPHPLVTAREDRPFSRRPTDAVLATSMLQVGVDVSRFGLMVVTGQPKNTAEYIQASSRVGRDADRPGLVVTLYNWSRPRDLSHFEDFVHYHATFYKQVEALSVTPYTRRSLDRGTTATVVAAIRNQFPEYSPDDAAYNVDTEAPAVRGVIDRMLDRAEYAAGEQGRQYLSERIGTLTDAWNVNAQGPTQLGYQDRSQTAKRPPLVGLLRPAGEGEWDVRTAPMSMRETENEVNLLVPGSLDSVLAAPSDEPDWEPQRASTEKNDGKDEQ